MPEWLINLIVSIFSATLSAVISIVVANKRTIKEVDAKQEEMVKRYELDKKQHISQMRLDMEFAIYKELSEKVVELMATCLGLFYKNFDYSTLAQKNSTNTARERYNRVAQFYNEANNAINKYAIFIPDKWYKKFQEMKVLCKRQLFAYKEYVLQNNFNHKPLEEIEQECSDRRNQINDVFEDIVRKLRQHIKKLGK